MRKMKMLVSVLLTGAMILATSVSAFATTGVTVEEQRILDTAKTKAVELGVDVNSSAKYKEYISQTTTYLSQNDLSQKQIDALVVAIDGATTTAKSQMVSSGVNTLTELNTADFETLLKKVEDQVIAATKEVGITIQKNADGSYTVLAAGKVVVNNNSPIKQTGTDIAADKVRASVSIDTTADMTTTVMLGVMFVGAVAVCGVVAKKKKLFSGVEA